MAAELVWAGILLGTYVVFADFVETFRTEQLDARNKALQAMGLVWFPGILTKALRVTRVLETSPGMTGTVQKTKHVLDGASSATFQEDLEAQLPNAVVGASQFQELGKAMEASADVFQNRRSLIFSYTECIRLGTLTCYAIMIGLLLAVLGWAITIIPDGGRNSFNQVIVGLQQAFLAFSILTSVFAFMWLLGTLYHRGEFLAGCERQGVLVSKQVFNWTLLGHVFGLLKRKPDT